MIIQQRCFGILATGGTIFGSSNKEIRFTGRKINGKIKIVDRSQRRNEKWHLVWNIDAMIATCDGTMHISNKLFQMGMNIVGKQNN